MDSTSGYRYLPSQMVDRLRGAEIAVHRPMDGTLQGLHQSHAFGSSVEFAEYREYLPGDPIARIDWPVYARSDRYMIRQYHEDVSIRCYILLDVSESMKYREGGIMSKMEYGCMLAAGIMYMMVQQGDTVSLITFDEKILSVYEPAGTFVGLKPMLEGLEEIEPVRKGDIEKALHEAAEYIKGKRLVVVISDLLQEPSDVIKGVGHLCHDGKEVTLFHVLDPAELQLPMKGLVDITALEGGGKLTVDLGQIQQEYIEQVRGYLDELRDGCMRVRAEHILTRTSSEPYEFLLKRSR